MKPFAEYLDALPKPYKAGRAFRAEFERLLQAWKGCPSRKYTA